MQDNIEALDRTLKDVMRSHFYFEGKATLFLGDFRQILSVFSRGSETLISTSYFKRSPLFSLLKLLRLTTNMNLLNLKQYAAVNEEALGFPKYLLDAGNGSLSRTADFKVELLSSVNRKNTIQKLFGTIFSGLDQKYVNTEWLILRAITTC